jgi:ribosomal protein S6--L-glutamate ligase
MRIGLVTSRPDHPLLADTTALLTPAHDVVVLDPERAGEPGLGGPLADVYLLKARTPRALDLAEELEMRGAPVLNSASATRRCQDRTAMADLASSAGLPFAATTTFSALRQLAAEEDLGYPLVVKSRHSRRGDLVARVDDADRLAVLGGRWAAEPVVVQPFTENSGWDLKLWVIDGQVFSAPRRSELARDAERGGGEPGAPPDALGGLTEKVRGAVRAVAEVFGLQVYGVDIIDAGGVPQIVDINAFPGARGQAGAPKALAELALRTAAGGAAAPGKWRVEPPSTPCPVEAGSSRMPG